MQTLINDPFQDDAGEMLEWLYGKGAKGTFLRKININGDRVGQAFMNALRMWDEESYLRLTGTVSDPFYDDSLIPAALDLLTSK